MKDKEIQSHLNNICRRVGICHDWIAFNAGDDELLLCSRIRGNTWRTELRQYLKTHGIGVDQ